MLPYSVKNLIAYFSQLPGIGQRQATRIVFALINKPEDFLEGFGEGVAHLKQNLTRCGNCGRIVEKSEVHNKLCSICADSRRNKTIIAIVKNEIDLDALEETGEYAGIYFVFGGLLNALTKPSAVQERKIAFLANKTKKIAENGKNAEIILALDTTPSGNLTALYIEKHLKHSRVKITRLGQGLPTGGEMEYADRETLKNSLLGRR